MSGFSTLVNNFDLILENQHEIMDHAPYRFSHINLWMMRPLGELRLGSNYTSIFGSHLGSYLMVWESFYNRWVGSDIIPLRAAGSPLSGRVFQFVGYSRTAKKLISETPEGFMTGGMLRYVSKFREMFPQKALAVPIEQVVAELKENKPMEERESYQLLSLREDFCRAIEVVSGIESGGEDRISYNLLQNRYYYPVVTAEAVLEIELTDEERRRFALNGTAVYVADMIREMKDKLSGLAASFGFTMYERQQQCNSVAVVEFNLRLDHFSEVLETATVQRVAAFLNEVKRQCTRF